MGQSGLGCVVGGAYMIGLKGDVGEDLRVHMHTQSGACSVLSCSTDGLRRRGGARAGV